MPSAPAIVAAEAPLDLKFPDREGRWRVDYQASHYDGLRRCWATHPATLEIDVYPLDPVGGALCVWGEDIGGCFDGPSQVWSSDEWLGHVPVACLDGHFLDGRYTYLGSCRD